MEKRTFRGSILGILVLSIAAVAAWSPHVAGAGSVGRNLRVVAQFPEIAGTDIDFDGDKVYLGSISGTLAGTVHVMDISRERPRLVGAFECGAGQTDVAALGSGLIAVGNHQGVCGTQPAFGINLFDVSDPASPKQLGFWPVPNGTHTLTKHPTEPLIYTSDSGYQVDTATHIIDVSDPMLPREAATKGLACHDITFRVTKKEQLGFCAVGGNSSVKPAVEIWNVADPLDPKVIGRVSDEGLSYPHQALATPDGDYLVVSDEAIPASCNDPAGRRDYGAVSIYDIRDRTAPRLVGYINVPRGDANCWAHNFNFIPGTRTLVGSWYDGGVGVYDLRDPSDPSEIAYFRPDSNPMWSAYWHRGRIYANGFSGAFVLQLRSGSGR